jgi:hypothetical protein
VPAKAKRGGVANVSTEIDGLAETIKAVQTLEREYARPAANKQLRAAARECATPLAAALTVAASASGVPVAPRVARSIRVKSDRLPVVTIGGATKVGSGKRSAAAALVWGSEQGPKSEPNRFAVDANPAGYWIAPTVARFGEGPAVEAYKRAVYEILKDAGLL